MTHKRRYGAHRGEGRLGCILWILLAGLIVYAGYKIIPVRYAASRFQDFMAEEAAFASNKPNSVVMTELLSQAEQLELPITKDQVEIVRTRESITIAVHYSVPIDFFGQFQYVWKFDPSVARPVAAQ